MNDELTWKDKLAIACASLVLALLMAGGLAAVALAVFLGRLDWWVVWAIVLITTSVLVLVALEIA